MNSTARQADLRDLLRPLLRRWWLVVVVVVVATGLTYRHYDHQHTHYSASTLLYVQSSPAAEILTGQSNASGSRNQTTDLAVLATSLPVARSVASDLKSKQDPRVLAGHMSAAPLGASGKSKGSASSDFLTITAHGKSAKQVIRLANAFARTFIRLQNDQTERAAHNALTVAQRQQNKLPDTKQNTEQRNNLQTTIQQLEGLISNSGSNLRQIDPAVATSTTKDPKRNAIFAAIISFVLVVALILLLDRLDKRVRRTEDLGQVYGTEVIGLIPRVRNPSPVAGERGDLPDRLREPFRRLRTVLTLAAEEEPIRTLLVTSAAPKEGKSTVARNLALAYQEAGRRVLLLDGDLRKPGLDRALPVTREPGLVEVLTGEGAGGEAVSAQSARQTVKTTVVGLHELAPASSSTVDGNGHGHGEDGAGAVLDVITSGRTVANPLELLSTARMRSLLAQVSLDYDIVIIDTPPVAAVSDAVVLMSEVDAVLLVARPGVTRRDAAENVRIQLGRLHNVRVLGVVANRVAPNLIRARGYDRPIKT